VFQGQVEPRKNVRQCWIQMLATSLSVLRCVINDIMDVDIALTYILTNVSVYTNVLHRRACQCSNLNSKE
ncbi:unnamed protein product, partial [Sphenostylis stenocarpa]